MGVVVELNLTVCSGLSAWVRHRFMAVQAKGIVVRQFSAGECISIGRTVRATAGEVGHLLALIYSAAVVSIIYFLSAVLKRSITASILGFFLLLMIIPIVTNVISLVDVDPWWSITHSAGLITDVLGVGTSGGFGPGEEHLVGGFSPDFYVGTAVMVAYAVLFFIAAVIFATRRRME